MQTTKKIIILTSRENFAWTSMQEIIPMIEETWFLLCKKNDYQHLLMNVDSESETPTKNLPDLITSHLIVITCFNAKIARFVKILRDKLKIDTRIVFYIHGLATVALWPLQRFGILPLLTSNDSFIGTCEGDVKSMELSLHNARVIKIPFLINNLATLQHTENGLRPLVYIGRLSSQKNIDLLIMGYAELTTSQKLKHPLFLYGIEDHLGYPNLGVKETLYLEKLKKIISDHNLEKFIFLKGFVDRFKIQEELGYNYIFVSLSTHSDENFGMAAFRALLSGASCLLSRWGGHIEYSSHYENQIQYITPELSSEGPFISLSKLKESLVKIISSKSKPNPLPPYFSIENVLDIMENEINYSPLNSTPLIPTPLSKIVFQQQVKFEAKNEISRCFHSFEDPAFIIFFKAYAGQLT